MKLVDVTTDANYKVWKVEGLLATGIIRDIIIREVNKKFTITTLYKINKKHRNIEVSSFTSALKEYHKIVFRESIEQVDINPISTDGNWVFQLDYFGEKFTKFIINQVENEYRVSFYVRDGERGIYRSNVVINHEDYHTAYLQALKYIRQYNWDL